MRISDWSSDVCSSDLAALSILEQEPGVESWCFRDLDTADCEIQLHTSGTTGKPEAVIKPLRCLEAEVEVLEAVFGACGAQSVLATVPAFHIYGLLFRVLWPLSAGRLFESHSVAFDRKRVGWGKSVYVRVGLGGRCI